MRKRLFKKYTAILVLALTFALFVIPLTHSTPVHAGSLTTNDRADALPPITPNNSPDHPIASADDGSPTQGSGCGLSSILTLSFSVTGCIGSGISWFIGYIGSWLIWVAIWLIQVALALNSQIFVLPAVEIGWRFMRDVANMGFLLGIIVISFATIFRSQTYGMKQLLTKLIIAAILVNFSLAIAGIFFDVAGIPTQFFVDKIDAGNNQLPDALAQAFQINKINENNPNAPSSGLFHSFASIASAFASIFFATIFTLVIAVTLFAFAGMLLTRFVALALLLILMPMAILAWVFPILRQWWSKWVSTFMRWVFFAPVVMFFLYLALYTVIVMKSQLDQTVGALQSAGRVPAILNANLLNFAQSPALQIGEMVVAVGLVLGGLFAANALSIAGASAAYGFAKSWSQRIATSPFMVAGATGKYAGRYAWNQARSAGGGPDKAPAMQRAANRVATAVGRIPLVGIPFRAAAESLATTVKGISQDIDKFKKGLDDQNSDYRLRVAQEVRTGTNPAYVAALLRSMAEKGDVGKLLEKEGGDARLKKLISVSKGTGVDQEVLKRAPFLAEEFGKKLSEVVPKATGDAYELNMRKQHYEDTTPDNETGRAKGQQLVLYSNISNLRRQRDTNPEAAAAAEKAFRNIVRDDLKEDKERARYDLIKKFYDNDIMSQGDEEDPKKRGKKKKSGDSEDDGHEEPHIKLKPDEPPDSPYNRIAREFNK